MTRIIVFANRKGGCGKTTTAINISHAMAKQGKRVLLIDADPQAHTSLVLGSSRKPFDRTLLHFLKNGTPLDAVSISTNIKNLKILPSNRELADIETLYSSRKGKETLLAERLSGRAGEYDFIIIDPPPTAGYLMISALAAASEVYIPMQMHFYAMEGLAETVQLIYKVNAVINSEVTLRAIIPTFINKKTKLAREIFEDILSTFGKEKVYSGIRSNITLAEAPGHQKTIFEYAPKSIGAQDYQKLARKIMKGSK